MGKQVHHRAILFAVIALVLALLTSAMQLPLLTNKGSGSLEVIVQAPYFTQWLACGLLLLCLLVCFIIPASRNNLPAFVKIGLTLFAVGTFLMAGHSFRYSGKQHALIDSWLLIPVQTTAINPVTYIENGRVESGIFFTALYSDEKTVMKVFNGFPPWRLDNDKIIEVLVGLGAEVE